MLLQDHTQSAQSECRCQQQDRRTRGTAVLPESAVKTANGTAFFRLSRRSFRIRKAVLKSLPLTRKLLKTRVVFILCLIFTRATIVASEGLRRWLARNSSIELQQTRNEIASNSYISLTELRLNRASYGDSFSPTFPAQDFARPGRMHFVLQFCGGCG